MHPPEGQASSPAVPSCRGAAVVDGGAGREERLVLRVAAAADRDEIYRLRHEVYALELGQYQANAEGRLTDALDAANVYLVVSRGAALVGFVSITPPAAGRFSIDKYFRREQLPFEVDDRTYEMRLLTVPRKARQWLVAFALMWGAFRWLEARGATRVVAIGRREIADLHRRVGLKQTGLSTRAGAVTYNLIQATMQDIHESQPGIQAILDRVERDVDWQIGVPFATPAACYHGGDFFQAVGEDFGALDRLDTIISADVLDAWFPPSPRVVEVLARHVPRLLQTSPPTGCGGFVRAVAAARGVPPECVLPGAGSSDLIFRALTHWLGRESRVLLLDPTYGEYAHVLEQVIRCRVERLELRWEERFRCDPARLAAALGEGFDLVVLVNPNSPTGQHVARNELERVLRQAPPGTRVWVDETYVDYAGEGESLERFAAGSENVLVCKSLSKTYALSGARAAYLCAAPQQLESLRSVTPPWVLGLPTQVAAVVALGDAAYYRVRYAETHSLRTELAGGLGLLGWDVLSGVCNFLLCRLPEPGPDAAALIARCRERGLFLRGTAGMGTRLGDRLVRVAVKDAATNARMLEVLQEAVRSRSSI